MSRLWHLWPGTYRWLWTSLAVTVGLYVKTVCESEWECTKSTRWRLATRVAVLFAVNVLPASSHPFALMAAAPFMERLDEVKLAKVAPRRPGLVGACLSRWGLACAAGSHLLLVSALATRSRRAAMEAAKKDAWRPVPKAARRFAALTRLGQACISAGFGCGLSAVAWWDYRSQVERSIPRLGLEYAAAQFWAAVAMGAAAVLDRSARHAGVALSLAPSRYINWALQLRGAVQASPHAYPLFSLAMACEAIRVANAALLELGRDAGLWGDAALGARIVAYSTAALETLALLRVAGQQKRSLLFVRWLRAPQLVQGCLLGVEDLVQGWASFSSHSRWAVKRRRSRRKLVGESDRDETSRLGVDRDAAAAAAEDDDDAAAAEDTNRRPGNENDDETPFFTEWVGKQASQASADDEHSDVAFSARGDDARAWVRSHGPSRRVRMKVYRPAEEGEAGVAVAVDMKRAPGTWVAHGPVWTTVSATRLQVRVPGAMRELAAIDGTQLLGVGRCVAKAYTRESREWLWEHQSAGDEVYFRDARAYLETRRVADAFNARTVDGRVRVVPCRVVEILEFRDDSDDENERESLGDDEFSLRGRDYLFVEPLIEGAVHRFSKFNSNAFNPRLLFSDRHSRGHPLSDAFAHFSHHHSQGRLLVCDIQGVVRGDKTTPKTSTTHKDPNQAHRTDELVLTITDPQIHTAEPCDDFGVGNGGNEDAIRAWFSSHVCRGNCHALRLAHPYPADLESGLSRVLKQLDWSPYFFRADYAPADPGSWFRSLINSRRRRVRPKTNDSGSRAQSRARGLSTTSSNGPDDDRGANNDKREDTAAATPLIHSSGGGR